MRSAAELSRRIMCGRGVRERVNKAPGAVRFARLINISDINNRLITLQIRL